MSTEKIKQTSSDFSSYKTKGNLSSAEYIETESNYFLDNKKLEENNDKKLSFKEYIAELEAEREGGSDYYNLAKAQDWEYTRALQDSNYIYRLGLKAKSGDCNAIKKILGYVCVTFSAFCSLASNLLSKNSQMLQELQSTYREKGMLTNTTKKAVSDSISNNRNNSDKNEYELAQEYNDTIKDLELAC